jgi:hypothetical protein
MKLKSGGSLINESMKTVKLEESELRHLVSLITDNERDGIYYGNRKQYWKRSFKLKQKLRSSDDNVYYCPKCGFRHRVTDYFGFCSEECLNRI